MNFENKRNKIRVIYVQSDAILNKIEKETNTLLFINKGVLRSHVITHSFKSFQLLDSGWIDMNYRVGIEYTNQNTGYYSWEFDFVDFPTKLIPFVKCNFLTTQGLDYTITDSTFFNKASIWQILTENDNKVNAKLFCHIAFIDNGGTTELNGRNPECKVRLIVNLQNPEVLQ